MNVLHPRRGRPVVALALLLGGWVAARATLVEVMQPAEPPAKAGHVAHSAAAHPHNAFVAKRTKPSARTPFASEKDRPVAEAYGAAAISSPAPAQLAAPPLVETAPQLAPLLQAETPGTLQPTPVRTAAGHQLLWMAAVSRMPLPEGLMMRPVAAAAAVPAAFYPARPDAGVRERRWSADGWLMLRRGGAGPFASGPLPASYGASQAGAVLRYHLAPSSSHRPAAYVRASAALNGSREKEAAFGFSARPLAGIPITAALEARATQFTSGTRLRPAAMVVSEFSPADLPLGMRGEAYVQAGYVGGTVATAFADGQLRVDRRLAGVGRFELRAGAGVWGGAQKGASRLDAGPSATLGLPVGPASARLALDWRFRVSGNAAPTSGPALTLSAGF